MNERRHTTSLGLAPCLGLSRRFDLFYLFIYLFLISNCAVFYCTVFYIHIYFTVSVQIVMYMFSFRAASFNKFELSIRY